MNTRGHDNIPRRILTPIAIVGALIVCLVIGALVTEYLSRPVFAGPFGLVGWGPQRLIHISDEQVGFIDTKARVLLIQPLLPGKYGGSYWMWNLEKGPRGYLLLNRAPNGISDGTQKRIPWRDDSIIWLTVDGTASYANFQDDDFQDAFASNGHDLAIEQKWAKDFGAREEKYRTNRRTDDGQILEALPATKH